MSKIRYDAMRRTRASYVIEAAFEYFISLFVTGTLLGYILEALGFSDAQQGVILTVATFTCGAQLFAVFTSGKAVKRIVTIGHLINQLCFVLLYLLPIFEISQTIKATVFIILLFTGHLLNNAVNPAKISMYMNSVPDKNRGSFTAIKEMVSLAGGTAVSLIFGWIADLYKSDGNTPTGTYYIICCIALIAMMAIHTATLMTAYEKPVEHKKASFFLFIRKMLKSRELLKVIAVGVIWNIASGISVSFFTSYLRNELEFSILAITVMTSIGTVCRIIVSPVLGKIADKKSFSYSMTLCFAVVGVGFAVQTFVAPGVTRWLYIAYISLYSFAMAGINSGVINLIYDYVSPDERTTALGVQNAASGIAGFLATLAASLLLGSIQGKPSGHLTILGMPVYAQQILSLISLVAVIALIIYMRAVIAPMKRVESRNAVQSNTVEEEAEPQSK